ncbi:MAG: DUF3883 domain-containing protein, partial [Acidobacteriota bacterium]|nr:DUF3883 domain-containing protein [Acidobacteriota bacterium]
VAVSSEDGQPVIEGRILHRLLEKLETMKEALEGRVFDVIGEVLSLNDVNLPDMLRDAAYDHGRLEEYLKQIDRIDPLELKKYEEVTGIALARSYVNFTKFQTNNVETEEKRLMPCYVEAQFLAAAKEIGLRVEPRADSLWRIDYVPADLRSDRLRSAQRLGKPESSYRKLTFHKHHLEQAIHADAVLLGPGHPLYAAVDEKLNEKLAHLQASIACYLDPTTTEPYLLHFFEISIRGKDSKGNDIPLYGELVTVYEQHNQFEIFPSDHLLNLPAHPNPPTIENSISYQAAADYLKRTYQLDCRTRCQQERQHFARVCREYLERSFEVRIKRAQEHAMKLMAEASTKPEFKLAADEASRQVDNLQRQKKERLNSLHRLEIVRTGPVHHIATAIVLPPNTATELQLADPAAELDPQLRKKSELAAEEFVVAALKQEGFEHIERIGHLKLGFDIRAHRVDQTTGELIVKRIEVKGRAQGHPILLTTNEWYKAQQLADTYWLYVVWDPLGAKPELVRVQNPAAKLDLAKREITTTRFYEIPADAIFAAAKEISKEH